MKLSVTMAMLFVFVALILVGIGEAQAAPVTGLVDPGFSSGYNLGSTLSGTATYTFTNLVGGGNSPFVALSLAFEGNVFNLGATGVNSSSVSSGWGVTTLGLGTYEFALLGGTPISTGSSLTFTANYSLLGNALSLNWSEGGPWQQGFGVAYAGAPFLGGGSTTLTPEPGSLILLGSGLAGLGMWKRKQQAKA
jgi:hypothetical protein